MIIRPYQPADHDAVIALVRELQSYEAQYFDRMIPPDEIGPWYVERVLADCLKDDGIILIAERDAAVVGYASVFTAMSSEDERDEVTYHYGYVGDLVVTAADRGSGVGRALLNACEARVRAAGVRWLRIGVLANNHRAREVYGAAGFRDGHVLMEKLLDGPS